MNDPKIRFKGYTEDWEQRKLSNEVDSIDTGKSKFDAKDVGEYEILGSTGVIGYDDSFDYEGDFLLTARVGANAGTLYRHYGKVKITDNTVFLQGNHIDFIFYLLDKFDLKKLSFGSGQPLIKASELKWLELQMPTSNEERQRIADCFSTFDHLITLHQRKCEEVKKLKKYMLQKMFPKNGESVPEIRFSGFTDDWEQRKLGDIVEFLDTQRKPLEGSKRVSGPYPYYGASGIVDYVEDYLFDEELILLSEDGANITDRNYPVCFLASGKYWVNNHAHVLRAKSGYENNFICNSMERKDYTPYNTGMAMPKLNQEVCRNIPVICPEYGEQKKIGDYFRSLDNLITLHQRKCDELQNMKKYMLQNMFV